MTYTATGPREMHAPETSSRPRVVGDLLPFAAWSERHHEATRTGAAIDFGLGPLPRAAVMSLPGARVDGNDVVAQQDGGDASVTYTFDASERMTRAIVDQVAESMDYVFAYQYECSGASTPAAPEGLDDACGTGGQLRTAKTPAKDCRYVVEVLGPRGGESLAVTCCFVREADACAAAGCGVEACKLGKASAFASADCP